MTTKHPDCTWGTDRGWLTPEHERGCSEASCRGCRPCPKTHCAMRGRCPNHIKAEAGLRTCPACIARTRRDLAAIEDLYAVSLPKEAQTVGIESEAFTLIGPAADPGQWRARRAGLTDRDTARGWCDYPRHAGLEPDDEHHPYSVLGRWEMALRESWGPDSQLLITVTGAGRYLQSLLDDGFPHDDEFEAFASEIARCRTHLEQVNHDSRTPELGRHCPRCIEDHGKGPRLRKRWAEGTDSRTKRGDHDTWHCPENPAHWWSERDYRDRVATDYVQHASHLPAAELADRLGVPVSRVRKWAARRWDDQARAYQDPALPSRRRGPDGRKLYSVAAALRLAEDRCA